jgi:HSP20 family protein
MTTRLSPFEPLQGAMRWSEALDQLFRESRIRGPEAENAVLAPSLDISEDAHSLRVTVELPGLEKKDVDLQVKDGVLTLRGEKRLDEEHKDRNYHRIERRYGCFFRAVALPETVDASRVEATLRNGVLTVSLAKREESKPRPIDIRE